MSERTPFASSAHPQSATELASKLAALSERDRQLAELQVRGPLCEQADHPAVCFSRAGPLLQSEAKALALPRLGLHAEPL
jgi:hypothetical protein